MLTARPASIWKRRYVICANGELLATWEPSMWKVGGHVELKGRRYDVRANLWGSTYGMADDDGAQVAAAHHVARKHWSIEANGQTYEFRRTSMWRHQEELHAEGRRVGSVQRVSIWRRDVVADVPGLPLPVQIFVLAVALTRWASADATTAGAASAGGTAA